ncbi:hypothetical protein MMC29_007723 [Sticta canariensis]|nr:hypothetical protein [Sticta canariensis]
MRTKKNIRNQLYTQAFFGQLSGRCPCGNEVCTVSKSKLETTDSLHQAEELAMERARKEFAAMTKSLEELSVLEESSGLGVADRVNIAGTFKLVDIEGTIEQVENVGTYFSRVHNTKLETLRKSLVDNNKIAVGIGSPLAILKADIDQILGKYQAWIELVNFAVGMVQLFNVEKRFSLFEQDCRHIRYQAEAWAGNKVQDNPPTLRQLFRNPMDLEAVLEQTKKPKERKKRDIKAILEDRKRLSKLAIKDTQALNKLVPDQETKLPSLPGCITYHGIRVPAAIPQAIRQSAYDLEFICDEIHELLEELLRLRNMIRGTLMIWVTTSKKAWEYGKKHIHEFPDMRKYEYTRTALQVSYLIAFREEYKIFAYFLSDDRPKGLCPQFEATFVKLGRNPGRLQDEWDERVKKLTNAFIPVDEMLREMSPLNETLDKEMKKMDPSWGNLPQLPSEK